jgi:hypothetical protein
MFGKEMLRVHDQLCLANQRSTAYDPAFLTASLMLPMSEDIKSQLAKIYPGVLATPETAASKHPPYNYLSIHERDRITTLFWITDVICAADAIHKNAHPTIAGDEVYAKHYDKAGASVKLVFVEATYAGQRVVSTSFMTEPEKLDKFCKHPAIWRKS